MLSFNVIVKLAPYEEVILGECEGIFSSLLNEEVFLRKKKEFENQLIPFFSLLEKNYELFTIPNVKKKNATREADVGKSGRKYDQIFGKVQSLLKIISKKVVKNSFVFSNESLIFKMVKFLDKKKVTLKMMRSLFVILTPTINSRPHLFYNIGLCPILMKEILSQTKIRTGECKGYFQVLTNILLGMLGNSQLKSFIFNSIFFKELERIVKESNEDVVTYSNTQVRIFKKIISMKIEDSPRNTPKSTLFYECEQVVITNPKNLKDIGCSLTRLSENCFFLFGGFHDHSGVYLLNLKKLKWKKLITHGNKPRKRIFHSCENLNNESLILFGGENQSGELLNDLFEYDIKKKFFTKVNIHFVNSVLNIPSPRKKFSMKIFSQNLVVWGGQNEKNKDDSYYVYIMNMNSNEWGRKYCKFHPPLLINHATEKFNSKMFVFGGQLVKDRSISNSLYCLDSETWLWREIVMENPLPAIENCSLICLDDVLWVWGGNSEHEILSLFFKIDLMFNRIEVPKIFPFLPIKRGGGLFLCWNKVFYIISGNRKDRGREVTIYDDFFVFKEAMIRPKVYLEQKMPLTNCMVDFKFIYDHIKFVNILGVPTQKIVCCEMCQKEEKYKGIFFKCICHRMYCSLKCKKIGMENHDCE